ncbi:MAG: polyribonucleotide nucleotidyltransferase, partial [Cytophagales bacterium]
IKMQCQAQVELAQLVGSTVKRVYSHEKHDLELKKKLTDLLYPKVYAVAQKGNPNKHERSTDFKAVLKEYTDSLPADHTESKELTKKYYHDIEKDACRNLVLDERKRLDGRKLDEIRPIWSEIDYLPAVHGSAVFTRGETQSLTSVTLGSKLDEQQIDSAMFAGYNKFLLHYNFPGFSTGEVKPNRGVGRREVGHGNLALRALKKVLPAETEFPYTVRVVSDILESNGSSSMATVCAGSLALMDAGVPIKSGVSGIAMGLITDSKTGKYAVLSDILGDEDHLGDMDFKVTGTSKGITACQMDIKIDGLSFQVVREALAQAKQGREHILNEMNKTIKTAKPELKSFAPRMVTMFIEKEFIGAIIGPGGKIIQEMQKSTGAVINIEEIDGKGKVSVSATNGDSLDAALVRIKQIVTIPEVGETYDGIVKAVQTYGAFVEFMPGKDGLLHISEIRWERVENMDGILEVGEKLKVKLVDIDPKTGKYRLSRKVLLPKPENGVAV